MQPVLIVRDERFKDHLKQIPHLESPRRVKAFQDILGDSSLQGQLSELTPRQADAKELALVHTAEHIERVERSAEKPLTSFDFDTQATENSYEVASLAVGGIFNLLDEIWTGRCSRGFACVRPPGHHAEPNKAMGFCLFNNVALGARYLKEAHGARKVMIVDVDVHHGNGTQAVFYDTSDVLYVSMHQFPAFPGTGNFGEVGSGEGEGFTVNIPMGKGHGDADFSKVIYFIVNPLAQAYEPDMILVSCGFDLYYRDPLGGMRGTGDGYGLMTFFLLGIAEKVCRGRIAFIMEGGYSLRGIRECALRVMQELCGVSSVPGKSIDKVVGARPKKVSAIAKAMEVQRKYWKIFR
jgi:acetoin utilization deacetylase AcuC-like enzyme